MFADVAIGSIRDRDQPRDTAAIKPMLPNKPRGVRRVNERQDMGRSWGGPTSKIHAVVDTQWPSLHLALTPGETLAANYLAFVKLASIRIWLRA